MGGDTFNCGNWPKAERYNDLQKGLMLNWVLGFLSKSATVEGRPDILRNVDQATVAAWLDQYCAANPLESIPRAAFVLQDELTDRATRR